MTLENKQLISTNEIHQWVLEDGITSILSGAAIRVINNMDCKQKSLVLIHRRDKSLTLQLIEW